MQWESLSCLIIYYFVSKWLCDGRDIGQKKKKEKKKESNV